MCQILDGTSPLVKYLIYMGIKLGTNLPCAPLEIDFFQKCLTFEFEILPLIKVQRDFVSLPITSIVDYEWPTLPSQMFQKKQN